MPKPAMNKKDMPKARKGTLPRVIKLLMEDYKWPFLLAMLFMALYSLGNISPSIFIERISAIILKYVGNQSWSDAWAELLPVMIVMISILVITIVLNYFYARLMAVITQGFLDKMRKRMFNKMQSLPIKYFDAHGHGDIMSHYTNDIDTLRQLISQSLPRILQSGVMLVGLLGIMLWK